MPERDPRLAVRALILVEGRLLLVNAYPDPGNDLWCAPGGGVMPHVSLPDNLRREIREETGLEIEVGGIAGANEFHSPEAGFHQVDLFFRCRVISGRIEDAGPDPEGIVDRRRFFARAELAAARHKPDKLAAMAYGDAEAPYDPLEPLLRAQ